MPKLSLKPVSIANHLKTASSKVCTSNHLLLSKPQLNSTWQSGIIHWIQIISHWLNESFQSYIQVSDITHYTQSTNKRKKKIVIHRLTKDLCANPNPPHPQESGDRKFKSWVLLERKREMGTNPWKTLPSITIATSTHWGTNTWAYVMSSDTIS